jgi:hypothetical protein
MMRKGSMREPCPQQKKSVAFLPNVLMYRTTHINNFTDEEIHNTWYNDREMRAIVSDCVKTISLMNGKDEPFTSSTLHLRGLECRTPEGQKKRASHRFCAIDAVLEKQEVQWECTENDTNKIRAHYMPYSKPSHDEAHRIGLEDAKEAMIIYREADSCSLESSTIKPSKGMPFDDQFSTRKKLQNMKCLTSPIMSPNATMKDIRKMSHWQSMGRTA